MPARYMSGDIIAFIYNNELTKAQIVRTYPTNTGEYHIAVIDEDGRVFRRDVKGVISVGQRIPGTYQQFTADEALKVREKTNKLLKNEVVQDAIYTITESNQTNHSNKRNQFSNNKLELWDEPMRLAVGFSSRMSPELERYLTWSEQYKRKYEEALEWLRRNAEVSYEVYTKCVLGGMKQSDLAKERGVSRPAITLRKKAAIDHITEQLKRVKMEESNN